MAVEDMVFTCQCKRGKVGWSFFEKETRTGAGKRGGTGGLVGDDPCLAPHALQRPSSQWHKGGGCGEGADDGRREMWAWAEYWKWRWPINGGDFVLCGWCEP